MSAWPRFRIGHAVIFGARLRAFFTLFYPRHSFDHEVRTLGGWILAYTTVRFVDNVGQNFLFRGGETLTNDPYTGDPAFDYAGLAAAIASAPNLPPTPLPSTYYMVVINLEHPNERKNLTSEISFFAYNTDKGQLHLWDTNGTAQCYFQTDPAEQAARVATLGEWLPDPLIWRVATIRKWLEDPSTLPTPQPGGAPILIYVHCDGGCDRTSEMIGAYRLRYMPASWTMQDAWSNMYNEHPCTDPMGCDNYRAVQWYAFWLNQQVPGFDLTGIGVDGGCNNAGTVEPMCSPS